MHLASKDQYLQRAVNAKVNVSTTNLTTVYTAPTGGDFDFAIIESILVCDHGNQQTNVDLTIVDTSAASFSIFKQHNISAYATDEMLAKDLILTAGEILKIQVSHANIDVTASIVEYGKGD